MNTNALSSFSPERSAGEQAILDAAVRLFSSEGYDRVSMRRIAQEAGVSKANIYHHFESKEALYIAILHDSSDRLSTLIENLAEGRGDFDERLRVFSRGHLENLFENAMSVRLILRESFTGDEKKSRVMVEQFVGGITRRLIDIFRRGQDAGLLRKDLDPGLCAMLLLGSDLMYFQFYELLKFLPEADFALDQGDFSREMVGVMLKGMLAAPATGEAAS